MNNFNHHQVIEMPITLRKYNPTTTKFRACTGFTYAYEQFKPPQNNLNAPNLSMMFQEMASASFMPLV